MTGWAYVRAHVDTNLAAPWFADGICSMEILHENHLILAFLAEI